MIYKDFHNLKLSSLGMGCMRFPTKDNYGDIDVEKKKKWLRTLLKKVLIILILHGDIIMETPK